MAPVVGEAFDRLLTRGVLRLKRGRVITTDPQQGPAGAAMSVLIQDRARSCTEATVAQRVIFATASVPPPMGLSRA